MLPLLVLGGLMGMVPALLAEPLLVIVPKFASVPVRVFGIRPLLVIGPLRPFVTGPLLVIRPDDVSVPVLSNVFGVVRMPVGPIVMVPGLTTGPLLLMVPKSVIRPV